MKIPPQYRAIALIGSSVLILFWLVFLGVKIFSHPARPIPVYQTGDIDRNLGWVAAKEAGRIKSGQARVVLVVPSDTGREGNLEQKQAENFLKGFNEGSGGVKILGKKGGGLTPDDPGGWVGGTLYRDILSEFSDCNLVVSFCGVPGPTIREQIQGGATGLPHLMLVMQGSRSNETTAKQVRELFGWGLVDEIFCHRELKADKKYKDQREAVEDQYWIFTKENMEEMLGKMQ